MLLLSGSVAVAGFELLFGSLTSYPLFAVFGLPVVLILRNRGILTARNIMAASVLIDCCLGGLTHEVSRGEPSVVRWWIFSIPVVSPLLVAGTFTALPGAPVSGQQRG